MAIVMHMHVVVFVDDDHTSAVNLYNALNALFCSKTCEYIMWVEHSSSGFFCAQKPSDIVWKVQNIYWLNIIWGCVHASVCLNEELWTVRFKNMTHTPTLLIFAGANALVSYGKGYTTGLVSCRPITRFVLQTWKNDLWHNQSKMLGGGCLLQ